MTDFLLMMLLSPLIGSFLGVVILRLPLGQTLITGRSTCPQCNHKLAFWHLIPFVSYLIQRGRCGYCAARIPRFYPAVELAAMMVVLWASYVTTGEIFIISCFLGWALLTLGVIDWRNLILPDIITLPLMAAGLAVIAWINPDRMMTHALGALAAAVIFAGLNYIYRRIRNREGLGGGDVKLFAAAGAWVGLAGLGSVLLMATLLALMVTLAVNIVQKKPSDRFQKIPFGSYLSLGIWLIWLYGPLTFF